MPPSLLAQPVPLYVKLHAPDMHGNSEVELLGRYSNHNMILEKLQLLLEVKPFRSLVQAYRPPKQVQTRLDLEQQAELVARYREGESVYALSDRFKINRRTVSTVLERHRVPRRYNRLAGADLDVAIKLYQQGVSLAGVGQKFDLDPGTVSRALRKSGVTIRPAVGGTRRSTV